MKRPLVVGLLCLATLSAAASAAENPAIGRLRHDADRALRAKPGSVMDKSILPPSGDKHDYLSLAPYYWPNPATADHMPWLHRDGEVSPESREGTDHNALDQMAGDVETLALAYHLTHHRPYGEKAVELLRVWFLDPATRMNPNLQYGQGVPGHCTGRGIGIIDTVRLIRVVESIPRLRDAPGWTPEMDRGLRAWFGAYLDWMLTSKYGRDESRAANNHGSWYLAQAAAYAMYLGDTDQARKSVELGRRRIAAQIEPDGRQPHELRRTKSYSYTLFNLQALFTLAEIGRRLDIDLFAYRMEDGRSLRAAVDYVAPYFDADKPWPHQQIKTIHHPDELLASLLRRAAIAYREPRYEAALAKADLAAARFQLLWPR